jgi:hypothetical protein
VTIPTGVGVLAWLGMHYEPISGARHVINQPPASGPFRTRRGPANPYLITSSSSASCSMQVSSSELSIVS